MLRCLKVSKTFGEGLQSGRLLDAVSLQVNRGESVAIVGPSGSGKTTLLHLLAGLERVDQGEIWLADQPLHQFNEAQLTLLRRQRLGLIFQFFNLIPTLTVAENLQLPLQLCGKPFDLRVIDELLERLGLADKRAQYPDRLSGGEQQRVAIARAIIHQPQLLLADEPTGSLDNSTASAVINMLFEAQRQQGQTLILVTHNLELARSADRCFTLRCGQLRPLEPQA